MINGVKWIYIFLNLMDLWELIKLEIKQLCRKIPIMGVGGTDKFKVEIKSDEIQTHYF